MLSVLAGKCVLAGRVPLSTLGPLRRAFHSRILQSKALQERLDAVKSRHDDLVAIAADPEKTQAYLKEHNFTYDQLYKEQNRLADTANMYSEWKTCISEISSCEDIINGEDEEMRELAIEEKSDLETAATATEKTLLGQIVPQDAADDRNVILEIRPGTGGDEASIFALELYRMYQLTAKRKGWKFETIDVNTVPCGTATGVREASANICAPAGSESGVYKCLKFESGVHRVQRIPLTEGLGRVHTSTATVAVLPEAEEVDVQISMADLRIETFRSSGAGGQHVNTTDSAVRITHIPTGLVVSCQDDRSQHKNKKKALSVLRARLFEQERRRVQSEHNAQRASMIGGADRSERIRTYNFPQQRITDHRLPHSRHDLQAIMEGGDGLDEFSHLLSEREAELLLESIEVS